MKKLMFAVGLGLISGSLWAACMGPYCYDDKGAQVAGGLGIAGLTKANLATTAPAYTEQMINCTDCTRSNVCISSGTGKGAWVVLVETGTMATPTACQ